MEKYTKVEKFADIKAILETVVSDKYDIVVLKEFCDEQIASLEKKAAKAKETAAAKKNERDELCDAVLAAVTNEPMTRDQIAELVDFEDASVAKVGARLTKLVASGDIVKGEIKATSAAGKKTTRMVYSLPTTDENAN